MCDIIGEEATRQIINEGRKIANGLQGHKKAELQHMCDEAEIACNQLADLCRKGMVGLYLALEFSTFNLILLNTCI